MPFAPNGTARGERRCSKPANCHHFERRSPSVGPISIAPLPLRWHPSFRALLVDQLRAAGDLNVVLRDSYGRANLDLLRKRVTYLESRSVTEPISASAVTAATHGRTPDTMTRTAPPGAPEFGSLRRLRRRNRSRLRSGAEEALAGHSSSKNTRKIISCALIASSSNTRGPCTVTESGPEPVFRCR
jgi:hypothetical protein